MKTINYRKQKIKLGLDECSQSYYFEYKGKKYDCGTYNFDYLGEIIAVVDKDLDKVFYVKDVRPHTPSAKVYNRYGVWYCDFNGYADLLVSYGDLNNENLSREDLTAKVQTIMMYILENEK